MGASYLYTMNIIDWLKQPWPWYVAGPLIGLERPPGMQRGDAGGEVGVAHLAEPGLGDHRGEGSLVGEAADALHQVLVGRPVVGHPLAR